MAFPVRLTLGLSVKTSADFQSEEVSLIVSWELERKDTDLQKVVAEKTEELEGAFALFRQRLQDLKGAREKGQLPSPTVKGRRKGKEGAKGEEGKDDAERLAAEMAAGEETPTPSPQGQPSLEASPVPLPSSPPDPHRPLTEPQKQAVLLLADRVIGREKLASFLQEVTGKDDLSALTWLEAATVIAQLQKRLRAQRAKEANQ